MGRDRDPEGGAGTAIVRGSTSIVVAPSSLASIAGSTIGRRIRASELQRTHPRQRSAGERSIA